MAMRPSLGMPSLSKRAKRVLLTIAILIVLIILWFQFVGIYVNWAWFHEVGFTGVYTTQLVTRVVLFLIAGLAGFGVIAGSLMIAYRSRPVFVPSGEVDPLSPYRTVVSGRPKAFTLTISIIVGLICGLSAQGEWSTVQLWLHARSFGQADPQFGHDIGFYVFILPMLQLFLTWLFVFIALAFFTVLITQYLFSGIRLSGSGRRISAQATLQLALLIGAFVLIKAVQYWFDRYDLLFSGRSGIFTGASYTDVNAVLPAKIILMVIAGICAAGFITGAFLRSVRLPAVALALLVLSSVLIGGLWPLILQSVGVNPSKQTKEQPYISRNITATQQAFGLNNVKYQPFTPSATEVTATAINDQDTVSNARLLDPNVVSPAFQQLQQKDNFFGFPEQLNVDRYTINGKSNNYVVAARELVQARLAGTQTNWISQHMVYTHGDGFVIAPANTVVNQLPAFQDSSLQNNGGDLKLTQPRIYYGGLEPDYAIVGGPAGQNREFDTDASNFTYTGSGGVDTGSIFERLIFATHYSEPNILFSSEINSQSKILYNRDPVERVQKAAPFLTLDTHPYPAVVDGRIVWIVDGYTTIQNYPYAQQVPLSQATENSLGDEANTSQANTTISYIRNSVKATVDAYDGTVTLYENDATDPILKAWEGVFPGLIKPSSAISADLRAHFRYPQDLFDVQRSLLVKYHVTNPVQFFNSSGFWDVPNDPTFSETAPQPPYYLQVKLPGATDSSFQLTSVLTGYQRPYMNAYMSASSDPATYGQITVLTLPENGQTPGPGQIYGFFKGNSTITSAYTLANNGGSGSQVIFGNLLTLPVGESLLYIEPFYVRSQTTSGLPQLNYVLVWYANQVGVGTSLLTALEQAVKVSTPPPDSGGTGGGSSGSASASVTTTSPPSNTSTAPTLTVPSNAAGALTAMAQAQSALDQAKASGDLGQIGVASQALEQAVQQYLKLAGLTTAATSPAATAGGSVTVNGSSPATGSTG